MDRTDRLRPDTLGCTVTVASVRSAPGGTPLADAVRLLG